MGKATDENAIIQSDASLPPRLLILPVTSKPLFPGVFAPMAVKDKEVIREIETILEIDGMVGIVLSKEEIDNDGFEPDDLFRIGTAAKIVKRMRVSDDGVHVFMAAIKRFRWIKSLSQQRPFYAAVEYIDDVSRKADERQIRALMRALISEMRRVMEDNPLFNEELKLNMINIDHPGKISDFIASVLNIERGVQQQLLETANVRARMERVLVCIKQEQELLRIQRKIQKEINEKIEKSQREYFLREELKEIKKELGMPSDSKESEFVRLKKQAATLPLPTEARERVDSELEKFQLIDKNSPEFHLTFNYLETILSLPWKEEQMTKINLERAARTLNRDHYKLDDVKERILEFMAVTKLNKGHRGSIICLLGPPGVGKTSLGRSIARALNRKFYRFSVGGMRDEAEIKGHRRTYIGAMPGKIIQGLRVTKENNPVFMIDEIDKLTASYMGDPSSALLEVLDPEQNKEFRDHYLDLPFDLSRILFVTTANSLDTIPSALLDRMEVITLAGYITEEKLQIARRYLIPRSLKRNGITGVKVMYARQALIDIANKWAREAGVRNYEKALDKIHRKLAYRITKEEAAPPFKIESEKLSEFLGMPLFRHEEYRRPDRPGMVVGLAWTPMGGAVLTVEAIARGDEKRGVTLTGQLGEVMQESAQIASSYAQQFATRELNKSKFFETNHIHIHIPAGATRKDGPSAGITMAAALISLVRNKKIAAGFAMTGELSLVGDVLPIGGLKEKVIAAKRNKLKQIIIPAENRRDLEEIPDNVKRGINFHPVEQMNEVAQLLW